MRWVVVAGMLAAGAARADGPYLRDWVLLGVAEALVVTDTLQALDIKNHPQVYEQNPLLGERPSDRTLLIAGAAATVGLAAAWALTPEKFRWLAPAIVIAVEFPLVMRGRMFGLGFPF